MSSTCLFRAVYSCSGIRSHSLCSSWPHVLPHHDDVWPVFLLQGLEKLQSCFGGYLYLLLQLVNRGFETQWVVWVGNVCTCPKLLSLMVSLSSLMTMLSNDDVVYVVHLFCAVGSFHNFWPHFYRIRFVRSSFHKEIWWVPCYMVSLCCMVFLCCPAHLQYSFTCNLVNGRQFYFTRLHVSSLRIVNGA